MELIINNKTVNINTIDKTTGVNAFWVSAFYGHGGCLMTLAKYGIDIFNQHSKLKSNALHVAILNKHYKVVQQLINSNYPINDVTDNGFSPLMLCAQ